MTYDNFTIKAQEAILKSQQLAGKLEQQGVDTVHLIKGIIETDPKLVEFIFNKIGINLPILKRDLNKAIETYPKVSNIDKQYLTNDANQSLARAKKLLKEGNEKNLKALNIKSEVTVKNIDEIFTRYRRIYREDEISESHLTNFYRALEQFYKNCK